MAVNARWPLIMRLVCRWDDTDRRKTFICIQKYTGVRQEEYCVKGDFNNPVRSKMTAESNLTVVNVRNYFILWFYRSCFRITTVCVRRTSSPPRHHEIRGFDALFCYSSSCVNCIPASELFFWSKCLSGKLEATQRRNCMVFRNRSRNNSQWIGR